MSIDEHGVRSPVIVYYSTTHGRAVIDGINRATIAAELHPDRETPVSNLGRITDEQAQDLAIQLNSERRHLSLEEQHAARKKRLDRVIAARAAGKSTRAIADDEQVSQTTIVQDIALAGEHPCSPESKLPRVAGVDGKQYPAVRKSKPKPKLRTKIQVANHYGTHIARAVAAILKGSSAKRLETVAAQHGIPFTPADQAQKPLRRKGIPPTGPMTRWPALDALLAVLRDISAGATV